MSPTISSDHRLGARASATQTGLADRTLYWGDLHNHNAVGYAKGSLARSIDLARGHLDFFAFTGHAAWHDMPVMPGDRHMKWVHGFEAHSQHWEQTQHMIEAANVPGEFAAFLGYEWHSSHFGDYCVIFPESREELFLPDHADRLLDFAESRKALAIPHHVAYKQGWRGANWHHFRGAAGGRGPTPVVEIFSEHGCTESDNAPAPMIRHSNGGRSTANTIERQLQKGLRFGFVASTDDHLGYPGAWGEGVVGVWAEDLSRAAILDAVRSCRTVAATGDRIALECTLNDQPLGAELPYVRDRQLDVRVDAQDEIRMIELIRNGRVIRRHFPEDESTGRAALPGRAKCRVQFGWGPWADLNLGRVCDWDFDIRVEHGRILRATPCFQAAPFDEDRRDSLQLLSQNTARVCSATSRVNCYGEDPTKAVVLEIEGAIDSRVVIAMRSPTEMSCEASFGQLLDDNAVEFTGVFTSESIIIGRLVGPSDTSAAVRWQDTGEDSSRTDWYYVRVTQKNGQMAWSSPVWVDAL
ncbi:MAG: DUF3604 domain-containing protein [Planctomycetota bacterium]|nr:DUF3604 domain-containing protein [Planctomycetota bacterium]